MQNKILRKFDRNLEKIKTSSIDRLTLGVLILASIAVPISLSRTLSTGWQNSHFLHIGALFLIAFTYFYRNKLSNLTKVAFNFSIGIGVSIVGLLDYGNMGNGVIWAMYSIFLSLFFFKKSTTYIVSSLLLLIYGFSFYSFVFKNKSFPGGTDAYLTSMSSWGTTLIGSAAFIILLGAVISTQREKINTIMSELNDKNKALNKQNKLINQQKKDIEHLALHDVLTGLPTLRLSVDRLELAIKTAKRANDKVAVLFLDLDGFKQINDTYGHDFGDSVLKKSAEKILVSIREKDTACRIGGDEFLIVLSNISTNQPAIDACTRLIENINQPVIHEGKKLQVSASIGCAIYPDHATDSTSLRKLADQLMYKVKKQGKNNFLIAT